MSKRVLPCSLPMVLTHPLSGEVWFDVREPQGHAISLSDSILSLLSPESRRAGNQMEMATWACGKAPFICANGHIDWWEVEQERLHETLDAANASGGCAVLSSPIEQPRNAGPRSINVNWGERNGVSTMKLPEEWRIEGQLSGCIEFRKRELLSQSNDLAWFLTRDWLWPAQRE